jgi:hypothetical protein
VPCKAHCSGLQRSRTNRQTTQNKIHTVAAPSRLTGTIGSDSSSRGCKRRNKREEERQRQAKEERSWHAVFFPMIFLIYCTSLQETTVTQQRNPCGVSTHRRDAAGAKNARQHVRSAVRGDRLVASQSSVSSPQTTSSCSLTPRRRPQALANTTRIRAPMAVRGRSAEGG